MTSADRVEIPALAVIIAGWIGFVSVMIRRPKPPAADPATPVTPAKRDKRSMLGIALQGVGFALVWTPRHWGFARLALARSGDTWGIATVVWLALVLIATLAGVLLLRSAIHTLGREWSIVARVTGNHRLITSGPYSRIRHPIYTAMLLMLLATGLALSGPVALSVGLVVFSLGMYQRVRIEEELLRRTFGQDFEAYAERVPAVVPLPRSG